MILYIIKNKPILERIKSKGFIDLHIKSIVRGNLSKNYWSNITNPHSSINKYFSCSSSGKRINSSIAYNNPPDIKYAFLKHYSYKSFEEYCMKIKRGSDGLPKEFIKKKLKILLETNKNNQTKLNIIKKIFNLTL